jgi:pyridoxamine 5'-phosphate oxidase
MTESKELSEKNVNPDPFIQFDSWYRERLASGVLVPSSVSLGTASSRGQVSIRTVLLKDYNNTGFIFFTNINSKKAMQLSANPLSALLFFWPEKERQIRIEGSTSLLSDEDASAYFATRPRESQIGAWASEQSSVIPDRRHLVERYELYKHLFEDKSVEKPPFWGGYRLEPSWFEFWESREHRLHDRICYSKKKNIWVIERLAP